MPPSVVEPVATVHGACCWAASELVDAVATADRAAAEHRAFLAISTAHPAFVPPRSAVFARTYAADHGMREPWT